MPALIDTNILVYRFDPRFPEKQHIATELLRLGITQQTLRVPHQGIIQFVAAVTKIRLIDDKPLLSTTDACREAEEFLVQFQVLYPNESIVRTALRGAVTYQLSWFDAHIWAYAEHYGMEEIVSENFQHGRLYGSVRIRNPFLAS